MLAAGGILTLVFSLSARRHFQSQHPNQATKRQLWCWSEGAGKAIIEIDRDNASMGQRSR